MRIKIVAVLLAALAQGCSPPPTRSADPALPDVSKELLTLRWAHDESAVGDYYPYQPAVEHFNRPAYLRTTDARLVEGAPGEAFVQFRPGEGDCLVFTMENLMSQDAPGDCGEKWTVVLGRSSGGVLDWLAGRVSGDGYVVLLRTMPEPPPWRYRAAVQEMDYVDVSRGVFKLSFCTGGGGGDFAPCRWTLTGLLPPAR